MTGRSRYLADVAPPGTLRAAFVRSFRAHGTIRAIDTSRAAAIPGVAAVFTADDLPISDLVHVGGPTGIGPIHRPMLARDRVRYVGEPIAVVVAESIYVAADGAACVWPEIDPIEAVSDPRVAADDLVLLFPEAGTNVVLRSAEQHGPETANWPTSVTVEVENQRLAATPIETLGVLAVPGGGPRLTVWCAHQAPHQLRRDLARTLGLPESDVRVRIPSVGGAFGLKGLFHPEYAVVAAAAMRLGRPVLWSADRREEMVGAAHGRGQVGRITLSGEHSGRIRRAEVDIIADMGAYPHSSADLPLSTCLMATGPYDIPEVTIRMTAVVTNRAPVGAYRGAGRPEAAYLLERAIDAYARRIGLDPAAVRRANFIPPAAMPHRTPTGALYDGGNYAQALDRALELADADAVRVEQAERRRAGEDPVGLGIGVYMDRSGGGIEGGEYARVEIDLDGKAVVRTGSTASGQGHSTVWRQVLADALSIAPDEITVIAGDTEEVARGVGTFGSRSTQLGATAAHRAAIAVVDRARTVAAEMLEASESDVVLERGAFHVAGAPNIRVSFAEVAQRLARAGEALAADEDFLPGAQTYPYGVFVAVVEVDVRTGTIRPRHVVAVNDCGALINPMLAGGQVVGSAVQGIGQALSEEIVYDGRGQILTSSLMDYLLPTAASSPRITLGWLTTPAPSNALGAKGIGESGCIGAPQAIVNATLDALAPWGVDHLEMPLRPATVWAAIQKANRVAR